MDATTLIAICIAAVAILAAAGLGLALLAERRRTDALLAATREDAAQTREELDRLAVQLAAQRNHPPAEYVITNLGHEADVPTRGGDRVSNALVLNATLQEPVLKAAAFAHGVRRALSAENRNRIRFEMRREFKRARKQRRREMKEAWRRARTDNVSDAA